MKGSIKPEIWIKIPSGRQTALQMLQQNSTCVNDGDVGREHTYGDCSRFGSQLLAMGAVVKIGGGNEPNVKIETAN